MFALAITRNLKKNEHVTTMRILYFLEERHLNLVLHRKYTIITALFPCEGATSVA